MSEQPPQRAQSNPPHGAFRPETRAIHDGLRFRGHAGPVVPPIYATSTFLHGNPDGYDYTRSGNPNFTNLEDTLAGLENAAHATVFSSGVAAITAVTSSLKLGDLVLAEENIYGCTFRLFSQVFEKFGVRVIYMDFSDRDNYKKIELLEPELVWLESPTNPMLKIIDIEAVSRSAHKVGASVLVDNTFCSGFVQQPLSLGADLSLSSTTKYVNGHSDCLGGVVVTNDDSWGEKMVFAQKALGLNPSPFDAWLIARGVKTLAPRMHRHQKNALLLARHLEERSGVRWVRYPFLRSHPQHDLARRQMSGGSGIVTADLGLDLASTQRFLANLTLFTFAESLGGVESLICHPATMTHASVPRAIKERLGISDGVVRFSVGTEHVEDLIADIEYALEGAYHEQPDCLTALAP